MNKFAESRARALINFKNQIRELDRNGKYEHIAAAFPSQKKRSKEEWEKLMAVCKQCCPDGYCKMCGCKYKFKLIIPEWDCQLGKFDE